MRRRRPIMALLALAASAALLIGAAGQLAKMVIPDSAPRAASADVAPILIGGFLIGAAAQLTGGGDAGAPDRVISAMNKAELVGA
ncbi:hypothetical protein [Streptomyces qinzhouensis]|uniref:Uncharacterized protein n=1 Tax=Streptomyces qinzhouensis TaxID=2599401 RepID=A0A5B8IC00_9ACTN|nr:hypothetical protein [Streptomyces qinzhouensis]QDY75668.1 hypothetical protein FQU76_03120 [Streptomyces qinzhouensis]